LLKYKTFFCAEELVCRVGGHGIGIALSAREDRDEPQMEKENKCNPHPKEMQRGPLPPLVNPWLVTVPTCWPYPVVRAESAKRTS
jgi:hypothetical protein